MMLGFVRVKSSTFYDDIWPQIKDDVEIIESSWDGDKKGEYPAIIKWGYKDLIKETITLAISQHDGTREEFWVVSTLIQRVLKVSYIDLAEQRINLFLKKSDDKVTESDLKELESVAVLMRKAVSSVTLEKDKKFLERAEKLIATLESNLVKRTTGDPID